MLTTISRADTLPPTPGPPPNFRVALVNMPFGSAQRPSIQLGILHAVLQNAGFSVDSYHLNLHLAATLTPRLYEALCHHRGRMTGEWLFSATAFPEADPDDNPYFDSFPEELEWLSKFGKEKDYLSTLRHEILPGFVAACAQNIDWSQYSVVGFSTTFQQTVASAALARRIKENNPAIKIVFGGANADGDMGRALASAFSFIDFVVSGEGEQAFVALLRQLANIDITSPIEGVLRRVQNGLSGGGTAAPIRDLDALPVPSYEDYFRRAAILGLFSDPAFEWMLPFESSRGCWWGQKHHCTFCGLNGQSLVYRRKSPQVVLNELSMLGTKFRTTAFEATDNIMDLKYVAEFFAVIQEKRLDYCFFYEAKANLSAEQIRTLYCGGVRRLQPGIESLSSRILKLMKKGCTMLQNVLTLKWCRYFGISAAWNLLYGFPDESEEDYREQLQVLQLIQHFEPPQVCNRIWLERFAPYYFDREKYPIHSIRPDASYSHAYPREVDLPSLAYFFEYKMDRTVPEQVLSETKEFVTSWQELWKSERRPTLYYRKIPQGLIIDDYRDPNSPRSMFLAPGPAAIYEYCSREIRSETQIQAFVEAAANSGVDQPPASEILDEMCRDGLMVHEDSRYLSLALPSNPNW